MYKLATTRPQSEKIPTQFEFHCYHAVVRDVKGRSWNVTGGRFPSPNPGSDAAEFY